MDVRSVLAITAATTAALQAEELLWETRERELTGLGLGSLQAESQDGEFAQTSGSRKNQGSGERCKG